MPDPDIDSSGMDPGIAGSQDRTGCSAAPSTRMHPVTVLDHRKDVHLSQARVSRVEHGDVEKMQVESVAAIGGHLRLVADFDQATTTFIDYTDALTA